jgi:hypothetical protein
MPGYRIRPKNENPSFLLSQEPLSTTFEVPAFAGTTGESARV